MKLYVILLSCKDKNVFIVEKVSRISLLWKIEIQKTYMEKPLIAQKDNVIQGTAIFFVQGLEFLVLPFLDIFISLHCRNDSKLVHA